MTNKKLKLISYMYLIIPIIIFVIGYIRTVVAIPIILSIICVLKIIYNQCKEENDIVIPKKSILPIFLVSIAICFLGGHGGLWYQSSDWDYRNAIFRDLINFDWPVYYKVSNTALTYYIGQWMFPAVIGKIFIKLIEFIFEFLSTKMVQSISFCIGNIALLAWNSFGVAITLFWLVKTLKLKKKSKIILATIIFLFFSGLDIIGMIICRSNSLLIEGIHIEWWAGNFQYSSMITQLFWVFNQCIPIWIITFMFFNEKKVNNYMLLIILSLPFSPLAFVGFILLFGTKAIELLVIAIKDKKIKEFMKDVFSLQNILPLICIFPIYLLYYLGNASVNASNINVIHEGDKGGFNFFSEIVTPLGICILIIFWFLEVGIYGIFLIKTHKKNPLFWVIMISLIFIPLFRVGYAFDFCMRASIPLIVIIDLWIVDLFVNYKLYEKTKLGTCILGIVILLGFCTSFIEVYRGVRNVYLEKRIDLVCDNIKTLSEEAYSNFVTEVPNESSIFFKYISKKIDN